MMLNLLILLYSYTKRENLNRKAAQMTIPLIVALVIGLTLLLLILGVIVGNFAPQLDVLGSAGANASKGLQDIDMPGV